MRLVRTIFALMLAMHVMYCLMVTRCMPGQCRPNLPELIALLVLLAVELHAYVIADVDLRPLCTFAVSVFVMLDRAELCCCCIVSITSSFDRVARMCTDCCYG